MNRILHTTAIAAFICVTIVQETRQEVPLAIRKQLASVNSTEQLISTMIRNKDDARLQRKDKQDTAPFECMPREVPVDIPVPDGSDFIYYPICVGLLQCSGCCDDSKLKCSPLTTQLVTKEVMKLAYDESGNDLTFVEYVYIPLDEHVTCGCNCRVTIDNCDPKIHYYDSDACLCRCRDTSKATSCPPNKFWSDNVCDCVCPELIYCLSDEVYDFSSCRCTTKVQSLPVAADSQNATTDQL